MEDGDSMNQKTFVIAAGMSFIAAVLTSGAGRTVMTGAPLYLIQHVSLR